MDRFRETGKKMNRKGAADAAGQKVDGQTLYAASDRRKDTAKILMYFLAREGARLKKMNRKVRKDTAKILMYFLVG